MLSKSSSNPKAWIFMLQEQTNLFLLGQNVLIVTASILINKDVFEASFDDFKFTVQNCNYCCTNLITVLFSFFLQSTSSWMFVAFYPKYSAKQFEPMSNLQRASTIKFFLIGK